MNDINALLPHLRLKFNIEHPSYEECYSFGYECAMAELDESENPFRENTPEADQWLEGWWAGFYGEKPIYEISPKSVKKPVISKAANDHIYTSESHSLSFIGTVLKITGAIAASAVVTYQVFDLVA